MSIPISNSSDLPTLSPLVSIHLGFPRDSSVNNLSAMQDTQELWVRSLGWKKLWKRRWQPPPDYCLEKPMGSGAWQATVQRVSKSQTQPKWLSLPSGRQAQPYIWGFQSGSGAMVKNLLVNAGDTRDAGLIPVWGLSLEESIATHSSTFAWRIPWTEEPGGLQSMGSQRIRHDWAQTHTHMHTYPYICSLHLYLFPLCK